MAARGNPRRRFQGVGDGVRASDFADAPFYPYLCVPAFVASVSISESEPGS